MAVFLHLRDLKRNPWTAELVRIFEGGVGIHGPLNRSVDRSVDPYTPFEKFIPWKNPSEKFGLIRKIRKFRKFRKNSEIRKIWIFGKIRRTFSKIRSLLKNSVPF